MLNSTVNWLIFFFEKKSSKKRIKKKPTNSWIEVSASNFAARNRTIKFWPLWVLLSFGREIRFTAFGSAGKKKRKLPFERNRAFGKEIFFERENKTRKQMRRENSYHQVNRAAIRGGEETVFPFLVFGGRVPSYWVSSGKANDWHCVRAENGFRQAREQLEEKLGSNEKMDTGITRNSYLSGIFFSTFFAWFSLPHFPSCDFSKSITLDRLFSIFSFDGRRSF